MDDNSTNRDHNIYNNFCNGAKNQSREQVRLAGEIARRLIKGSLVTAQSDILQASILNFCQVETNLENIGNNLDKIHALTRNRK